MFIIWIRSRLQSFTWTRCWKKEWKC